MRIAKWGKSLAVRLPRTMVETLQLKEGDDVQISVTRGSSLAAKAPAAKALIDGLRNIAVACLKDSASTGRKPITAASAEIRNPFD